MSGAERNRGFDVFIQVGKEKKGWFQLLTARTAGVVRTSLPCLWARRCRWNLERLGGVPTAPSQTWGFVHRGGVPGRGRAPDARILRDDEDSAPVIGFFCLPPFGGNEWQHHHLCFSGTTVQRYYLTEN
jgi:hypothetical protein